MDIFRHIFESAQCSNFLIGKETNWRANLDWLMESNHFLKTYNGYYDNTSAQNKTVPTGGSGTFGEAEKEAIRMVLREVDDIP